jgi:hypothetical protein
MTDFVPPTYRTHLIPGLGSVYECERCSVLVLYRIVHTGWHADMHKLLESLAALTKAFLPNAPDGTLITGVPELKPHTTEWRT